MPAALSNGPPPETALALSSFSDTTPVVIDADSGPLSLCVDDVLKYIAPGAPRHEALLFLMTCKAMRINPMVREAFLVPQKDKWATVVAKAGYIRAAQRHESYDGHEAGIVGQPYDPAKVKAGSPPPYTGPPVDFDGSLLPAGFLLVGGWAKVWRKGVGRPIASRVSMQEYARNSPGPWQTLTSTMIRKVALVAALREAFSLSGYDEAEMPVMQEGQGMPAHQPASAPAVQAWVAQPQAQPAQPAAHAPRTVQVITHEPAAIPAPAVPAARRDKPAQLPAEMAERLHDLMAKAGMSDFQINTALVKRGVDRIVDLDVPSATQMINKLEATLSVADWDPLKDADKPTDESEEVSTEVTREAIVAVSTAPRVRQPGDDDEPFDDATGKVLSDPAEIAAEFDKPIDEATAKELKEAKKASKKAATVAP